MHWGIDGTQIGWQRYFCTFEIYLLSIRIIVCGKKIQTCTKLIKQITWNRKRQNPMDYFFKEHEHNTQSWISSIPWMAKQQIVSFSYYENLNIVLDFTIIARFLFVLLGYSDHFLAANSRNHSNNNTYRPFVFETHLCNSGN